MNREVPEKMSNNDDLIPKSVEEYRKKEYWDWRYEREESKDGTYEWFKGYEYFRDTICKYLKTSDQILMLGCGNSRFSEEMCQDGYEQVVNVDYSERVIEMMRERTKEAYPSLKWLALDFRDMNTLSSGTFDVVLDKGSLDALWSDGGSQWNPSDTVLADINATLKETLRILKSGSGKFISITFGQPHFRLPHLKRPGEWSLLCTEQVGLYYIYIFQKDDLMDDAEKKQPHQQHQQHQQQQQ